MCLIFFRWQWEEPWLVPKLDRSRDARIELVLNNDQEPGELRAGSCGGSDEGFSVRNFSEIRHLENF